MTTQTTEALEVYESKKPLNVDPGVYDATVDAIETVEGQYGTQWRFTFKLGDYPDELPWAWASAKLGTKTKLWRWAVALLGRPLGIGEKLTPRQLVGCRCQVNVTEKPDANGDLRRVIGEVLRAKAAKAPPQPPEDAPATPAADLGPDCCWCTQPVHLYTPAGVPLCEKHAADLPKE
jgi:hypothetical protein